MSGSIERKIITDICNKMRSRYPIQTSDKSVNNRFKLSRTKLPQKHDVGMEYQPDMILRNKKTGKIEIIIEVETDPVRKSLVGAAVTADYCISIDQPGYKPKMLFIIGEKGLSQLENFKARTPLINKYVKYIKKPVRIGTEKEIWKFLKSKS